MLSLFTLVPCSSVRRSLPLPIAAIFARLVLGVWPIASCPLSVAVTFARFILDVWPITSCSLPGAIVARFLDVWPIVSWPLPGAIVARFLNVWPIVSWPPPYGRLWPGRPVHGFVVGILRLSIL